MNNEQINAAIARACGWRKEDGVYVWHNNNSIPQTCWGLWDYCNDLNAMHEAEKMLGNISMYDYASQISRRHDYGDLLTATARQRAEAFLRTLGKWEEVQG